MLASTIYLHEVTSIHIQRRRCITTLTRLVSLTFHRAKHARNNDERVCLIYNLFQILSHNEYFLQRDIVLYSIVQRKIHEFYEHAPDLFTCLLALFTRNIQVSIPVEGTVTCDVPRDIKDVCCFCVK